MAECEHLSTCVLLKTADVCRVEPLNWSCAVCRSRKSPWICLACGLVHCGRYVNGHAKKHAEICPGHYLCMDQSLSIYCYKDDEFVVNDNEIIQQLRLQIEQKLRTSQSQSSSDSESESNPPPTKIKRKRLDYPVRTGGLVNLGNTCFMNAILQSLNNLEQFYLYFLKLPSVELKNSTELPQAHRYHTRQNGDMEEISLVEEMRKVSCALWEEENEAHSPTSLFAVVWRLVPRFRGYQQQDAHEFMRYLLDKLHTEFLGNQRQSRANVATHSKTSMVSELFGGLLQSDVTCLTCKRESQKLDPILDVSLDVPKKEKGTRTDSDCQLTDCLRSFTEVERLVESEWYYCTCCKARRPSTKQLTLHTLPNVLCIHLKRFHFTAFSRTKLNSMIKFPLEGLDMSPYAVNYEPNSKRRILYDLVAIVVHHGSGITCGHYTSYALSPKSGSWYHFNDSTVTESTAASVLRQKAYILFYVLRDSASASSSTDSDVRYKLNSRVASTSSGASGDRARSTRSNLPPS